MSLNLTAPAKARSYLAAAALLIAALLSVPTGATAQSLIIPGSDYGIGSPAYQPGPWTFASPPTDRFGDATAAESPSAPTRRAR